jgi:hypothetical protein
MNPLPALVTAVVAVALLTPSASAPSPLTLGAGAALEGLTTGPVTAVASLPPAGTSGGVRRPRTNAVRSPASAASTRDPRAFVRARLSPAQYRCVVTLWTRESHWNPRDFNPASGAYGIPQAVPGSKMASKGSDWRTNPITQVRWGLSYIAARYGTPCTALRHSYQFNWY